MKVYLAQGGFMLESDGIPNKSKRIRCLVVIEVQAH